MLFLANNVHKKNTPESQDRRNFESVRAPFVIYTCVMTLHSCYNFALVLHEDAFVCSQSEASTFVIFIITWKINSSSTNQKRIMSSFALLIQLHNLNEDE